LIAYLDTHVLFWLCENRLNRISGAALDALNQYDLLISPMVAIELAFLHEIGRSKRVSQDILRQLREQVGLKVCDHSFADVAEAATFESWTRDPFDRMIVAHAKANGYAPLISADQDIRANYPKAVW
jgi:PIN domain nuclease of toxin-antitoxin system